MPVKGTVVGIFGKVRRVSGSEFARAAGAVAAAAALGAGTAPALANVPALDTLAGPDAPAARYDHASRTLFVGAGAASPAGGEFARITVSRAADIVGRPLILIRPAWSKRGGGASGLRWLGQAGMPSFLPLSAATLTSGFGLRAHPLLGGRRAHAGIDLAARTGSPIVATSDGMVARADWAGGYGLLVALDHGGGVTTRYGHMSRLAVAPGQTVRKGEVIGYVGSTGRSTGPHLHYEVRVDGRAIDPARTLRAR